MAYARQRPYLLEKTRNSGKAQCQHWLYYVLFFLAFISSTRSAEGQVQLSALTDALQGKEVQSLIVFGNEGIIQGASAPMSVNTLVYPDGQIIYKVEFGIVRGQVQRMTQSFIEGTKLKVTSVEIKDDRLELKLSARVGGGARLKLMLGSTWKTQYTNASVLEVLGKVIQLPDETNTNKNSVDYTKPIPKIESLIYHRSQDKSGLPERIKQEDVNQLLLALATNRSAAEKRVADAASAYAAWFRTFRGVYGQANSRAASEISQLQGVLGRDFIPKTEDDIKAMESVYEDCHREREIRVITPRFPTRSEIAQADQWNELTPPDFQGLSSALRETMEIHSYEIDIIHAEQAFDSASYNDAIQNINNLRTGKNPPPAVAEYLSKSRPAFVDLATFLQEKASERASQKNLAAAVHQLVLDSEQIQRVSNLPLARGLAQSQLEEDQKSTASRLEALPAYLPTQAQLQRIRYLQASLKRPETESEIQSQASEIGDILDANKELVAVTQTEELESNICTIYGKTYCSAIAEKGKGLGDLKELFAELYIRAESAKKQSQEQREEKIASTERKQSIAEQIVDDGIIVCKLEAEFSRKQIIGYRIEAQRKRAELNTLVHSQAALLRERGWKVVDSTFSRIVAGLTVSEAQCTRSVIERDKHQ